MRGKAVSQTIRHENHSEPILIRLQLSQHPKSAKNRVVYDIPSKVSSYPLIDEVYGVQEQLCFGQGNRQ